MFGLTFEKLLLIGVIAAFIIGPERLPQAAEKLREFVRWARGAAGGAKDKLREELGDEFDDVDWRKLDPRQYDPRRIIKEALLEDLTAPPRALASPPPSVPSTDEASSSSLASSAGVPIGDVAGPAVAAGLAAGAGATAIGLATAVADSDRLERADNHAAAEPMSPAAAPFDPEAT